MNPLVVESKTMEREWGIKSIKGYRDRYMRIYDAYIDANDYVAGGCGLVTAACEESAGKWAWASGFSECASDDVVWRV